MSPSRESADKRPSRREIAAADTRREILQAARRLFAEHGYPGTSVQQIADEAGVALQTIYSSVGNKAALVLALNDLLDEEADVATLGQALMAETRPRQLLAKAVHLTRQMNERCGDVIRALLSAESAEPDVAAAVADGMRRHSAGGRGVAEKLAHAGALKAGVTAEQAATAFSMMTSPHSWRQLTADSGWSYDEAEAWLTTSLGQLLLRR